MKCRKCGSHAINPHLHGREPEKSLDLCDVCYWRNKTQWQPIATAPKDRALLLACEFDCKGDWRIKTGGWNKEDQYWRVFGASWTPTHWQELPQPPQETE